jgi:hypothetical protein
MFGRYFFYLRLNFYFSSYFDAFLFIYSFNWLCWEHPILCQQILSLYCLFWYKLSINFNAFFPFAHLSQYRKWTIFVYGKEAINRGPNSEILVFSIFHLILTFVFFLWIDCLIIFNYILITFPVYVFQLGLT